jgi:hypothetical protein
MVLVVSLYLDWRIVEVQLQVLIELGIRILDVNG